MKRRRKKHLTPEPTDISAAIGEDSAWMEHVPATLADPEQWSISDFKWLVRLVRKYGSEGVCRTASAVAFEINTGEILDFDRRNIGRPSTEEEDMNLADWIYSKAEEYRQTEIKKPIERAESDLYLTSEKSQPYEKWQKRTKDKRLRGLQAWRRYAASAPKNSLPGWLKRYIK